MRASEACSGGALTLREVNDRRGNELVAGGVYLIWNQLLHSRAGTCPLDSVLARQDAQ
jgi:hypothetical protein